MKRVVALGAVLALAALAGCEGPTQTGLEVEVDGVAETGDGHEVDLDVDTTGVSDAAFQNPRVVGYDADGQVVCRAQVETGDDVAVPDPLVCERFPLGFEVRSDGETLRTAEGGERVSVEHRNVYYAGYDGGHVYERTTDDGVVRYAKCETRLREANVSAVDGPTPWTEWDYREPAAERTYEVTVQNLTATGSDGVETEVFGLPEGAAVDPVRRGIDAVLAAEADEPGGVDMGGNSFETVPLSAERFFALNRRLLELGRPVEDVADLPTNETAGSRVRVDREDSREVSCPSMTYEGRRTVDLEYHVRAEDRLWSVRATAVEAWSGPAFDRNATAG